MARRLRVYGAVGAFVVVSALLLAVPSGPASVAPRATSPQTVSASALTPSIYYNYSDFFNVPWGEWWDVRSGPYGDAPIGASCFNQTAVNDGTCTTNVAGISRVAKYPYEDWYPSALGSTASDIYAPYRVHVSALNTPGYNLSQPVFLPVLNYAAAPGTTLSWSWYMQYLDKANYTLLTSTRGCFSSSAAYADDGYQLWNKISITLDNGEAARLFGAPATGTQSTIQSWWNTNTLPGCSGKPAQSGALESSINSWFANEANGKYDVYNGYAGAYTPLYTNISATVVSGGSTGLTKVYLEHGAWGTEVLLDRWFYWGNATYTGNQLNSSKAAGWWPMENGWWEGVNYAGKLQATTMNFNLSGVLQYHFQERSLAGPDNTFRSSTNLADTDDVPVWTWGPQLLDYVTVTNPHPYSEIARYAGLNYIKTTPGSSDYGTNTPFDYVPISWAAKSGEWWNYFFPTTSAAYYQNPATATIGTSLPTTQLPSITSTLSFRYIFPSMYGTWDAATGDWYVPGGTAESWPAGTPGQYPNMPYPGIFFAPANIPPTVTTSAASSITTTAATLNGDLTSLGSASSVTVGFRWGTSASLVGATNVTVGSRTATGAFSDALSALTPVTTYYFQAWANGSGFAHGAILSFKTAGTPPTVVTDAASGITTSAATLNGHTTSLGTASSVSVGFLWGTSSTLTGAANVTAGTQTATAAFSSPLTGLASGTTYYFEAWANGDGFATGSILSFTTGTSATAPTVTTSAASSITITGATLNGDLTSLGSASSVTVGFRWGTSSSLSGATNVTVGPETATVAFNTALTGLAPDTTYYFQAWAKGNGFTFGVILSFTTASTPPTVVTDAVSGITTSAATLNGHTTSLGTASSAMVGFLWGTSSTLTGAANVTAGTQTATAAFSSPLTGLASGTTYYFEAWADGQGFAQGSILSFMTAVAPPVVHTNGASGLTASAAVLNGGTSSLGTAASITVGFLWDTSSTLSGATNVTAGTQTAPFTFSASLTGLTASTTYYFEAWANGDGFATGSILSFTTTVRGTMAPSVTTSAASGVTISAAVLYGTTSSLGTAATVTVGFRWGTSSTLAGATNASAGSQTTAGSFTASLSGLSSGTTYYFEAWANGDGFATGSILSFTTTAAASTPTVTTAAASGTTTTGATLNGNLASLGSASRVTVGFLWGTDANLVGATNVTVGAHTSAAAFTQPLSGLTPGTTYYFEAWASGTGFAHGAIVGFTTQSSGTTPSQPTFLGLPATLGYALVALIILIVVVAAVALIWRRRKSPPPANP